MKYGWRVFVSCQRKVVNQASFISQMSADFGWGLKFQRFSLHLDENGHSAVIRLFTPGHHGLSIKTNIFLEDMKLSLMTALSTELSCGRVGLESGPRRLGCESSVKLEYGVNLTFRPWLFFLLFFSFFRSLSCSFVMFEQQNYLVYATKLLG